MVTQWAKVADPSDPSDLSDLSDLSPNRDWDWDRFLAAEDTDTEPVLASPSTFSDRPKQKATSSPIHVGLVGSGFRSEVTRRLEQSFDPIF